MRVSLILLIAALIGLAAWALLPSELEREREALRDFLADHPYAQPNREETKGPPGLDDPGEAAKFEFVRTLDPALGQVPTERLYRANAIGIEMIRDSLRFGLTAFSPEVTTSWSERGPDNVGGRTRAIMFDPNDPNGTRVLAGGVSGGLWSTSDITTDGTPWVQQNDFWENLAVTAIAYDPGNTSIFYVATGEGFFNIDAVRGGGIFQSTDGGLTYDRLPNTDPASNSDFNYIQDLVVSSMGTVLASTRDGGVQRSADFGSTWVQVLASGIAGAGTSRAADLEIDADGNIYASLGIFSNGGVWKSTDDGQSWTQQTLPAAATDGDRYQRIEICTAPGDADTVYVVTQNETSREVKDVFRTTNGGTTWDTRTTPITGAQAWYDLICAVDPNDTQTLYLGVQLSLHRSGDGGGTWTDIGAPLHPDFHAIVFRNGLSNAAVIGHDGGIDYTEDFDTGNPPAYINRNDGYNVTQYFGGDLDPTPGSDIAIGGTQDNSTHLFDSPGIETVDFAPELDCCDGGFALINDIDPDFMIGSIQFGAAARSFDGGTTFDFFLGQNAGLFIPPFAMDDDDELMFSSLDPGGFPQRILRGSDMRAAPPVLVAVDIDLGDEASTIAVSPFAAAGTTDLAVGTRSGEVRWVPSVHAATDLSGLTTNITGSINPGFISSIEFGADEDQMLVTVSNYGVVSIYETLDGGANWADKEGDLPDMPVRWATYNPNDRLNVIAATESGIWETQDIGAASPAWVRVPGFPTVRVDQLQTRPDGTVYAFTHGRGVWSAQWRTAAPAVSTISVAADGSPAESGSSVTFTATVEATNPTGVVTFRANNQLQFGCEDVALGGTGNVRTAECVTADLPLGESEIVAEYEGDVDNSPATSAPLSQVVKAPQVIDFTDPGAQVFGPGVTFTLESTGGASGNPVVFSSTNPAVCTVSGTTASIVAAGTCPLEADQAGNDLYFDAPTVQFNVTIQKADQTIDFTDPADQTFSVGGTFDLIATASSGLTVEFESATPTICTVAGSTATIGAAGTCTINADQPGDDNYNAAPQVQQSVAIAKADQTIDFTDPADQTFSVGGTFDLIATASSGLTVEFESATPTICTVAGSTATIGAAGTCTINADQPGDDNYNAAPQVQQSVEIARAPQVLSLNNPGDQDATFGATFKLSAEASSGLPVSYASLTPSICEVTDATITARSEGTCEIEVSQAGNSNYLPVEETLAIDLVAILFKDGFEIED